MISFATGGHVKLTAGKPTTDGDRLAETPDDHSVLWTNNVAVKLLPKTFESKIPGKDSSKDKVKSAGGKVKNSLDKKKMRRIVKHWQI